MTSSRRSRRSWRRLAINPNTVLKAYRELEHEGLVAPGPGVGTFVTRHPRPTIRWPRTSRCAAICARWLAKARRAGLDDESIEALFLNTFRSRRGGDIA